MLLSSEEIRKCKRKLDVRNQITFGVMIAYFKNETISKNQLIRFVEKSYLTSNSYIDSAVSKNYFKTIINTNDKRSIFILPTELTIKKFAEYVDKRAWLYKDVK